MWTYGIVMSEITKEIKSLQESIRMSENSITHQKQQLKFLDNNLQFMSLKLELEEYITKELIPEEKCEWGRWYECVYNEKISKLEKILQKYKRPF